MGTLRYTWVCTPYGHPEVYPGVYSLVCLPGIPWVYIAWYTSLLYHSGYTSCIPPYPGVPVPPYTVCLLPADEALGSKKEKALGGGLSEG